MLPRVDRNFTPKFNQNFTPKFNQNFIPKIIKFLHPTSLPNSTPDDQHFNPIFNQNFNPNFNQNSTPASSAFHPDIASSVDLKWIGLDAMRDDQSN